MNQFFAPNDLCQPKHTRSEELGRKVCAPFQKPICSGENGMLLGFRPPPPPGFGSFPFSLGELVSVSLWF